MSSVYFVGFGSRVDGFRVAWLSTRVVMLRAPYDFSLPWFHDGNYTSHFSYIRGNRSLDGQVRLVRWKLCCPNIKLWMC